MSELLTIKETSVLTGKSEGVIYRYIRRGKIKCQTVSEQGKEIKKIKKEEAIKVFNIKIPPVSDSVRTEKSDSSEQVQKVSEQKENFKEVLEKFFEEKQTSIMKPIEEQALFIAGELKNENKWLRQQIETVRTENEQLKEEMKKLPDNKTLNNFEQVQKDLTERNKTIEKEKEWLTSQLEKSQALNSELQTKLNKKWWRFWG